MFSDPRTNVLITKRFYVILKERPKTLQNILWRTITKINDKNVLRNVMNSQLSPALVLNHSLSPSKVAQY